MRGTSIFGQKAEHIGCLAYLGAFVTGIIVYVMERDNKFVRFHALQSIVTFGALAILSTAVQLLASFGGGIPIIGLLFAVAGGIITSVLSLITLITWVYLAYNAYRGIEFKVPIIGAAVWEQVNK